MLLRTPAVRSVAAAAFPAVALAAFSLAAPAAAQEFPVPEDFGVFLPLDAGTSELSGLSGLGAGGMAEPGPVVRSRRVGLDEEAFGRIADVLDAGQSAPLVRLNLFPDVVVDSLVDYHDVTASGHSWSGGVEGDPTGSVAVAVSGETLHAIVRTGGRVYTITRIGEGEYSVRELDRSNLPDGMPPVAPPRGNSLDPPVPAFVDDPSRVDIAVFHTAQATQDAGGTDEIGALIDAWIADTNAAYVRSDIHHRLNLVLRQQVPYVEATDTDERSAAGQAIDCFDDADDGCLDLDEIREEFSADLVHLIISTGVPVDAETWTCGSAFMTGNYGVSELFCGSETFAHEIGHNSGVNHDRYVEYDDTCETAAVPCFGPAAAPYAYGYVNPGGLTSTAPFERRWRTLMSYSRQCIDAGVYCPKLMRFSNPAQSWYGDSLGVSGTHERSSYRDAADAAKRGPADAARTHRDFALDLANRVVRKAPDLTLKGFRAASTQVAPGGTVRLSTVVENLGISTGPVSDVEVRWCRASSSTCSSSARGVPAAVPALEANDRVLVSTSFEVPRSSGSYSFRACVSAAPGETLTKNNCSDPVSVDVGVVDLQFSMTLSPSSVRADDDVTIRGTVRNRGSIASSAGRVAFVTRDDAGDIEIVGFRSFSTIEAGSSKTFETVFEAPSVAGGYRYFVCLLSAQVEFDCVSETLTVTSSSSGTWSRSGSGNTILDLPTDVRFIHVVGEYTGYSSNFVIWCGLESDAGGLVVNELLGTGWGQTTYSGVHSGLRRYNGRGEPCEYLSIVNSTGVDWTITQRASAAVLAPSRSTGSLADDELLVNEFRRRHERAAGPRDRRP